MRLAEALWIGPRRAFNDMLTRYLFDFRDNEVHEPNPSPTQQKAATSAISFRCVRSTRKDMDVETDVNIRDLDEKVVRNFRRRLWAHPTIGTTIPAIFFPGVSRRTFPPRGFRRRQPPAPGSIDAGGYDVGASISRRRGERNRCYSERSCTSTPWATTSGRCSPRLPRPPRPPRLLETADSGMS